jgi:GH15 family glucan-1,4-alpha-glucosidase
MPSPLRSVMELRCPRCQAPSSRRRPTSASKSNLCTGPCKGRSDPGCGLLDWLCLPRFDSPSVFAALLDASAGGRFCIRPVGEYRSERRYVANTNVLETVFRTPTGACVLRDLISVSSEEDKRAYLIPEHEVLRELEGLEGEVELELVYDPRPDYGRVRPLLEERGALDLRCEVDGTSLTLRSEMSLELTDGDRSAGGFARIRSGERKYLSLTYSMEAPAVIPLLGEAARGRIERTVRWWQEWANRSTYEGPYREAVVRSALTLKLMSYAPSGALVAAPTTSLPEAIGGVRNWDYRYCWLRDASFTLRALFALGYREEAEAYIGWLLHATRLTWPELNVLYGVFGEAKLPERELPHLEGYAGSRPVRIGNDAQGQLQLDVYGEVINGAARFLDRGGRFDHDTNRMLDGLGLTVCKRWREPDEGIWEGRSGRFHNTHSKVLCWVALDRLIKMHEAGHLEVSVNLFRADRDAIRKEIEAHGYNERIRS